MSKRKILLVALTVCMVAILAAGGTIAYLFDSDAATNVFTTGNVYIDLIEDFEPNSKLIPGKDVKKIVNVKNTDSEPAYVRVHIAIPSFVDSGSEDEPQFAAYNNSLHFNMSKDSIADTYWSWGKSKDVANYPGNGGDWNFYQQEIDGILYNVYVVTYETALNENQTTAYPAIYKVYMDTKVTNQSQDEILEVVGGEIKILVIAEGGQVEGFTDAYTALNTQFGVPGTYEIDWSATTANVGEDTPDPTEVPETPVQP